MNNEDLAYLIHKVSKDVDEGGVGGIFTAVEPLRAVIAAGCHVGCGDKMDASEEGFRLQLEWYAGQLLYMVDEKQWGGINSWINCTDKFTQRKQEEHYHEN